MSERTIAIGDIHGCFNTLKSLLKKLKITKNDTLIFLGDYIDRGKYSFEVVNFLMNLQRDMGKDRCICLLGNHEEFLLTSDNPYVKADWKLSGGNKTIKSYRNYDRDIDFHRNWLASLPLYYETDTHIFCHTGLSYPNIEDNSRDDFLWGRNWIRSQDKGSDKIVVFGHTPQSYEPYFTKNGSLCIDTACVYGGNLHALVLDGKRQEFVWVEKHKKD